MVIIKNESIMGIWYDVEIGYYTYCDNCWMFDDFIPQANLDIPWDEFKELCVLVPWPEVKSAFSSGNLNTGVSVK